MIFITGPCQIESRDHCLRMAEAIADIAQRMPAHRFVFKASFDKANRTSGASPRGVGMVKAMSIFDEIKALFGLRIVTDVHEAWQCADIAPHVDVLQIPALLSRQTDLITAAAQTGKVVNIKKGQFMAPADMAHAVAKASPAEVWATERGTTFGHGDLVVDMRSIPVMKTSGASAVIFDATHSVQKPNGLDGKSGGLRTMIEPLALAAIAAGADGLFIEAHDDPDNALSDGPCMLPLDRLAALLSKAERVREAAA